MNIYRKICDYEKSDLMKYKTKEVVENLVSTIDMSMRTVADFPKEGIQFHDVTTVWKDPKAFSASINAMHILMMSDAGKVDSIVGIEARGWVYAATLADRLGKGFIPIRKHGKLPAGKVEITYGLEYGSDAVEMHQDAISEKQRVILVDDLIATGGSTLAAIQLVEQLGGTVVKVIALSNLEGLGGKKRLISEGYTVETVMTFPGK